MGKRPNIAKTHTPLGSTEHTRRSRKRKTIDAPRRSTTTNEPTETRRIDHLSQYFRDLSEHDLLDPEEEKHIAQAIEAEELKTWEDLLSYPASVDYLLCLLEARLENALTVFRSVRSSAAEARKARTKASKEKLRKAAGRAAKQLRALDQDRKHIDALLGELHRLYRGGASANHARLPFAPQSRSFTDYVKQVTRTHRSAAQLRDDFVRANLRLVVTMARRYDRGVMPLSDLIQEGNLGLIHAVSRFDHKRGLRFSTYACWWIRHAIGRALADKARTVRIPVHMIEAQQQLAKVKMNLVKQLGRQPTRLELAQTANVSMAKLNQMNRYLLGQPVSLDGPVHNEDGRSFGETLPDPKTEEWTPEDDLSQRAISERVTKLMNKLSPIEADVLRQRFGLADDEERTFREIGNQYKLSRERIRQIQNAALTKLRRALESDHIHHLNAS